ncbi:hypothetical protein [Paenibacillus flagellatus]|uniref:Uncharacterized protein n=1 Tax=Paenibacillus flagellatus TaxID=2211139 RepID=A0A2V5KPS2_9BACL|nr:hypothetical protein [Paenibacillus flagellatus]PYI50536.1 hypothetical protein DLM86_28975 [Paenibacillus flagellatus]
MKFASEEERRLFRLVESAGLDVQEAARLAGTVTPSEAKEDDVSPDEETIARIRARTFAKLGLPDTAATHSASPGSPGRGAPIQPAADRPRRPGRRRAVPAAALVVCLLSGWLAASPEGRAQVSKLLQFVPGFGTVQSDERNTVLFVLPSPVFDGEGSRSVEIRGISIGDRLSSIALTGTGGAPVRSLELVNEAGTRYSFQASTTVTSEQWTAGYYRYGPIEVTERMSVSFDGAATGIPVTLTPTTEAGRIEELGDTREKNGVVLTAVTTARGAKTNVTLVPQLPASSRIEAYGFGAHDGLRPPRLTDDTGKEVPIKRDETFPNANEFWFSPPSPSPKSIGYTLAIPEISVVRRAEKPIKVTVPIPQTGALAVNERIDLLGFPVDVLRAERLADAPESVRIDLDPLYDETAPESLRLFFPDFSVEGRGGGSSAKVDDTSRAIRHMTLEAPAGAKTVTFYVSEVHTVVRGPWEFRLTP